MRVQPSWRASQAGVADQLGGVGSRAWRYQARNRLTASAEAAAELLPAGSGPPIPLDDGGCLWETVSDSLIDLAVYITRLDLDFTVESPPELRTSLERLAARFTAASE